MKVNICKNYHPINILEIEKKFGVTYIGDFPRKNSDGSWHSKPTAIFYQQNPDLSKGHSHYMGVTCSYELINNELVVDGVFLVNGESAFSENFNGVMLSTGEVLISCFDHDYKEIDGSMVDGGRSYFRYSLGYGAKKVKVRVVGSEFELVEDEFRRPEIWGDFDEIKGKVFICMGKVQDIPPAWEIRLNENGAVWTYYDYNDYISDIDTLVNKGVIIEKVL
jgi:hypothetical protein